MTRENNTVALIGLGTIGLSFAALHLKHTSSNVRLFDVRDDLESYVASLLPVYLDSADLTIEHLTHIIPLIELVPSSKTNCAEIEFAQAYFSSFDPVHRTIVIKREVTGFVGNRLLFALFREACHLVATDVATVEDVDTLMEMCIGPRYSIAGPFKLWNFGSGEGGLGAFFKAIGETMENCWDDAGQISLKGTGFFSQAPSGTRSKTTEDWPQKVIRQTTELYGLPTGESMRQRDLDVKSIMQAQPKKSCNCPLNKF